MTLNAAHDAGRTTPVIEVRSAQHYVGIARAVTSGVADAVDGAFPALVKWFDERGIIPSGPLFIRAREVGRGGEPLRVEVAAPVAAELFADGEVYADTLPAGQYLTRRDAGPYLIVEG